MRPRLMFLIVVAFTFLGSAGAQVMSEYGKLPATPPRNPTAVATRSAPDRAASRSTNGATAASATNFKPSSPAVFVLSDGTQIESSKYVWRYDSVEIDQDNAQRVIPMKALDMKATVAANDARGIHLQVPDSRNKITIGF